MLPSNDSLSGALATERYQSPPLSEVLQPYDGHSGAASALRRPGGGRAGESQETRAGLVAVSGLRREFRVHPAFQPPIGAGGRARSPVLGVPRNHDGRRRPPGRSRTRSRGEGGKGQIPGGRGRRHPSGRRRSILHRRGQDGARYRPTSLQQCRSNHRRRRLRLGWRLGRGVTRIPQAPWASQRRCRKPR